MRAKNVLHLGVKELWSLVRDPIMLLLIVFAFSVSIYSTASALPDTLYKAPIAIVDEDPDLRAHPELREELKVFFTEEAEEFLFKS